MRHNFRSFESVSGGCVGKKENADSMASLVHFGKIHTGAISNCWSEHLFGRL